MNSEEILSRPFYVSSSFLFVYKAVYSFWEKENYFSVASKRERLPEPKLIRLIFRLFFAVMFNHREMVASTIPDFLASSKAKRDDAETKFSV